MKKVFLVTKLHSTNLGNQALSSELIDLFGRHVGKENLNVFGRPLGLYGYSIEAILKSDEPEKLLDKWADQVIAKYQKERSSIKEVKANTNFILTKEKGAGSKWEFIKRRLRPLRRTLKRLSIFDKGYLSRLDCLAGCDVVVYSGAGETGDNHVYLRQLLELRVAQKMGKITGAVNQSVVIHTASFKKIVGYVYGGMNRIVVRGERSMELLKSVGVKQEIIYSAPDTAILTQVDLLPKGNKKNKVGINFTNFINFDFVKVDAIVDALKKSGNEIFFITNEPNGDFDLAIEFQKRYGIKPLANVSGYKEYTLQLQQFDYIVSTRLHSCVLALSCRVPVIPIEGLVFKTRELMKEIAYPVHTVNVEEPNWDLQILDEISKIEHGYYRFDQYFDDVLPKVRAEVQKNVSWIDTGK